MGRFKWRGLMFIPSAYLKEAEDLGIKLLCSERQGEWEVEMSDETFNKIQERWGEWVCRLTAEEERQ